VLNAVVFDAESYTTACEWQTAMMVGYCSAVESNTCIIAE